MKRAEPLPPLLLPYLRLGFASTSEAVAGAPLEAGAPPAADADTERVRK